MTYITMRCAHCGDEIETRFLNPATFVCLDCQTKELMNSKQVRQIPPGVLALRQVEALAKILKIDQKVIDDTIKLLHPEEVK